MSQPAAAASLAAFQSAISVDAPLLRVPCESLKGQARGRTKVLNTELSHIVADATSALAAASSAEAQATILASLESRLQALRSKFEEVSLSELHAVEQCRARVEHLRAGMDAAVDEDALRSWERLRLDRRVPAFAIFCVVL